MSTVPKGGFGLERKRFGLKIILAYPNIDIFVSPDVSLTPEKEGVLGRPLLTILLLFVNVDLDLLNLKKKHNLSMQFAKLIF